MHLNERKVTTLAQAAMCADEFILTHKSTSVLPARRESVYSNLDRKLRSFKTSAVPGLVKKRECFYCYKPGHLIASCPVLEKKN